MDSKITRQQCRAARGLLGWDQERLAKEAAFSRKPIVEFERGKIPLLPRTRRDIKDALAKAGVEFLDPIEGGNGSGVVFKPGFEPAPDFAQDDDDVN